MNRDCPTKSLKELHNRNVRAISIKKSDASALEGSTSHELSSDRGIKKSSEEFSEMDSSIQ